MVIEIWSHFGLFIDLNIKLIGDEHGLGHGNSHMDLDKEENFDGP